MVTSFPPRILLCLDEKYAAPRAFLNEDAMQLMLDELAEQDPDGGWSMHDLSEDYVLRAELVRSNDGLSAVYRIRHQDGSVDEYEVEQFDRQGAAAVKKC